MAENPLIVTMTPERLGDTHRAYARRLPPGTELINQSIMRAAGRHPICYQQAETELRRWTDALLGDSGDTIAVLDFLKKRAGESQDRMRAILSLLV